MNRKIIIALPFLSALSVVLFTTLLYETDEAKKPPVFKDSDLPIKVIQVKVLDSNNSVPTDDNPECLIYDVLKDTYVFNYTEEPDFLFYTAGAKDRNAYNNCVKVFFTKDNIVPDFNKCDYGISPFPIEFEERHCRYYPLGRAQNFYNASIYQKDKLSAWKMTRRAFCYVGNRSEGEEPATEAKLVQLLSEYKKLDYISLIGWIAQGITGVGYDNEMSRYKFTAVHTAEGLLDALLARTVPIYYGSYLFGLDYNKKAFIDTNDYNSLEEVVQKVVELDKDDDAYMAMLNEPPLANMSYNPEAELKKFLINVIEKGNKPFIKNPLSFEHW